MTHEEFTQMGWHRKDIEPELGPIVLLYSWSLIPISISILMVIFDKYPEYPFYACLSALAMQSTSLYLTLTKRKISLHSHPIKNRLILTSMILVIFVLSRFTHSQYSSLIQVILTILFSYYILNILQIFGNNLGSTYQHPWKAEDQLSKQELSNWNVHSYLFGQKLLAQRKVSQINGIAWISGAVDDQQPMLVVDVFGHKSKDEFDFSLLEIDLKSIDSNQ
ncbi:MAG: hypothetical protein ACKVHN_05055 [Candidatus Poseidoniales archaeon]